MEWFSNPQWVKQDFDRQGYVVIRQFLGSEEVLELREEIERYIAEVVPQIIPKDVYLEVEGRLDTIKQLIRLFEYDSYFKNILLSDRYVKLAELLLGSTVVGKNMQWFNKPTGVSRPTPPHQDGYYFMLEPNEALTMWLALDEVGEDNGCVRYVTGSHLRGLRPHQRTDTPGFSQAIPDYGIEDESREVAITAQPGDLLVHHSLMIHRADANTSNRKRRAFGIIYYSANAKEDVEGLREYARTV
jgi:phytanoyl-CoA hydroxylase